MEEMKMFKINHEEAGKGFELIAKGDYEVTVINYELGKSAAGNDKITVDYEIRSDVQQAHQGQKVLYDNFTITDNALWRLQAISKAVKFEHGKQFSSYTEWAKNLLNKNLIITVGHREHGEKTYLQVNGFKESKAVAPSSGPITVSGDDLPF